MDYYNTRESTTIHDAGRPLPQFCDGITDRTKHFPLLHNKDVSAQMLSLPKYQDSPTEDLAALAQVRLRLTHCEKLFTNQVDNPNRCTAIAILEGCKSIPHA